VHDWDSLAWQPGPRWPGQRAVRSPVPGPPQLAPVDSSAAFLLAYQELRGRGFSTVEQEVAWAASLWMAA
jgi:hypothetical protein